MCDDFEGGLLQLEYCMRMHCNLRGSDAMRATYFQRYQEHGTFQEFEGPWDRVAKFLN